MNDLKQEIQKQLNIYLKEYNQEYIKCLIRRIEIPINGRPEELVRQIFLHFIIKESGWFPDKINVKVEANNHDIEIYKKQANEDFKPHQSPLIIVEVKREDTNLQNHYNQIQRYLTNAACNIGILYNYHQIIAIIKKHNEFEINYLTSLRDIGNFILHKNNNVEHGLLEFEKAQNGNLESFIYLVGKYGNYTTHKVVFKIKHQESEIDGYLFNVQGNKVYYKICGKDSQEKQNFDSQDFEKLISIRY